MADTTIKLRVLLEAAGIKPTEAQLKKLNAELQKTAGVTEKAAKTTKQLGDQANKTKRNLEGVAQRSGRAGKDFSRMAQGMGGLVQAYATVAANVFALSSAFLVLRRAADLSSMEKSAADFSNRFGVSVSNITKRMQEASGGALDFAEALPSINKAVSAGVGIEQLEQLTIAATKASQTFGGTTTEALNRFISASQRGRVEIIQTLGVVIKTEDAYKEYAASIGKTAQELTAFDRQQAILNATIKASQQVFAGVNIDPNPFTQFASTLVDLKNDMLTFVTDGITPLINAFNKSKEFGQAFIAILALMIGKRIFPELTALFSGLTAASIKSNKEALVASRKANKAREEAQAQHTKNMRSTSRKSLMAQLQEEEASYAKRAQKHAAFGESLIEQDGSINSKRLNLQRAALQKQINDIEQRGGKGSTDKLSKDTVQLQRQLDLRNNIGIVTKAVNVSEKQQNTTLERRTTLYKYLYSQGKSLVAQSKAFRIGLSSGITTGFSKSFQTMQSNIGLGIKKMALAWKSFNNSIGVEGVNSTRRFGEAFGRSIGVVVGGLARVASVLTSVFIYYQLFKFAFDGLKKLFSGISKEQQAVLDAFEGLGDSLEDITNRNENYIASNDRATDSLAGFIRQAEFLRGTFDSISTSVNDFQTALNRLFQVSGSQNLLDTFSTLRSEIQTVKTEIESFGNVSPTTQALATALAGVAMEPISLAPDSLQKELNILEKSFSGITNALDELLDKSGPQLIGNLSSTIRLLDETKFTSFSDELVSSVKTGLEQTLGETGKQLADLVENQKWPQLIAAMASIENVAERGEAFAIIAKAIGDISNKSGNIVGNFVASGKALEETNRQMGIYISGLEKARAASVPNKEVFNLLLDAQRDFSDLLATAQKGGRSDVFLSELANAPDLENLRKFINLDPGDSADNWLAAINNQLKIYNGVIEDTITKSARLAKVQNQIFALKNEEASTDERRVQIIKELEALEINKISIEKDSAQLRLNVAKEELARLQRNEELGTLTYKNIVATIASIEAEIEGHELAIQAIEKRKDAERERAKIIDETLSALSSVTDSNLQVLKIQQSLVTTNKEYLAYRKLIYKAEQDQLAIKVKQIQTEIDRFIINDKTREQDEKRLAELTAQLSVLKAQSAELKYRNQLDLDAATFEQSGGTVFSEEGLDYTARYFVRQIQSEAVNLNTTFETLGRGFAQTINDSFDLVIDNLLEGGKDFAYTVREGLKASLREVFGEALKNRIKESLAVIASNLNIGGVQKEQSETATLTTTIGSLILKNSELIAALNKVATAMTVIPKPEQSTKEAVKGAVKKKAPAIPGTKTEEGAMEDAEQKITNPIVSAIDIVAQANVDSGQLVVTGLVTLGSQIVSALFSSKASDLGGGGATGSPFPNIFGNFFAKGGIMKGRVTKFADGGYVSKPTMAMIGEGKNTEAVVPLPNNREIPVQLSGSGGDTFEIKQFFDFRNADPGAVTQLRAEARNIEQRTFNRVFAEINKGGQYAKMVGRR